MELYNNEILINLFHCSHHIDFDMKIKLILREK